MEWGLLKSSSWFSILASFVLLWISWKLLKKGKGVVGHLPPGPIGVPFLGYLPFLGKESHKTLARLGKKYGSVFGLYLGSQYFVVLDKVEAVKEAFSKEAFTHRPPDYFQITPECSNLIEINGRKWKVQRRFQLNTFNSLGLGKEFMEVSILNEIKMLIETLKTKVGTPSVNLSDVFEEPFDNIIYYLLYGKKFDSSHPYTQNLPEFFKCLSMKYRWQDDSYYFPWKRTLLPLLHPSQAKVERTIKNMLDIVSEEVKIREKNFEAGDLNDFIDHFLQQIKTRPESSAEGFDSNSLVGNTLMLLGAGSVTTRLTFTWFLMTMAQHPEIQDKVAKEIIDHYGQDTDPQAGDQIHLPYTCATIAESHRMNPISLLNLLRKCTADGATIEGFDIPKGTLIVQNMWSLNFNEDVWTYPDRFEPERFLSEDGFKTSEHLMPFSCGKRACPGAKLAEFELFLFVVCLLRRFKFLPPDGGVSKENFMMFNVVPVKPLVRLQLRK